MILKDVAFKDLEEFVDECSQGLNYIVVHFEVNNNKTKILKYFAPIYENEPVGVEELSKIFYYFLGIVVYDKNKFINNQTNIFSTIKKVIRRRLSQENARKVIKHLEELSFDNYKSFINSSDTEFIPILSDALHTVKKINALEDAFSIYDINFLTEKQRISIVKKSENFSSEIYDWATPQEQERYIDELFDINTLKASIYHESSKNIRKVLKRLELTNTLDEFFFEYLDDEEEQYLKFTKNFLTDNIKDELYKIISIDISNDISTPIHRNAEFYYTEIVREIKFVNLYELEDDYALDYRRNFHTIKRLFEKMDKDKLSTLKFYTHTSYANIMLNQATNIEYDIKDRVSLEIEYKEKHEESLHMFEFEQEEIRDFIEDEYLDIEDYKSEEIILSLDSDEYKSLTKRDKERLKQRKKRALQKRSKERIFNYEQKAKESDKYNENFNIKVSNKSKNQ